MSPIPSSPTVELGLTITGAAIDEHRTWITCRSVKQDASCPACGDEGRLRDPRIRELVDLPVVGHPTRLRIRLPRFTCANTACETKTFQQQLVCAAPKAKLTTRCARWILQRLAIDRMSVAALSKSLDIGWEQVQPGSPRSGPGSRLCRSYPPGRRACPGSR